MCWLLVLWSKNEKKIFQYQCSNSLLKMTTWLTCYFHYSQSFTVRRERWDDCSCNKVVIADTDVKSRKVMWIIIESTFHVYSYPVNKFYTYNVSWWWWHDKSNAIIFTSSLLAMRIGISYDGSKDTYNRHLVFFGVT